MIERLLSAERLLRYGMLDQAESLFQSVADAEPRNSFAFVGLARVAAERGDNRTAHRLSAEAARLDPENGIAVALAARTAELLAQAGTPIPAVPAEKPAAERRGLLKRVLGRRT